MKDRKFRRFQASAEQKKSVVKRLANLLSTKPEILVFAFLHGSFLQEETFRDIDLGVFVDEEKVSAEEYLDCELSLLEELSSSISYPLDIRVINRAPSAFRYNVLQGKLLFCGDEGILTTFIERTWDEYLDFQPIARRYLEEIADG